MKTLNALKKYAEESSLYICIDLASAPKGLKQITGEQHPELATCLLGHAQTTKTAKVLPWILSCPADRIDAWLPRSITMASESPSVSWVFSPLSRQELHDRMLRRSDVQFCDGTELMLRFLDPRILFELDSVLSESHHSAFFSFAERWCALDRDGTLQEIATRLELTQDPLEETLILDPAEERALLLVSEAGQVLTETLKRWPDDLLKIRPKTRFNLAKECCVEADRIKLDNLADKVLLLMHVAEQSPGYLQSLEWIDLSEVLRDGKRTLLSIFEESSPSP